MHKVKCGWCEKQLTIKMEVEYSRWLGEYFCNHTCAISQYFDHMGSVPLNVEDGLDELDKQGLVLKKEKLYYK